MKSLKRIINCCEKYAKLVSKLANSAGYSIWWFPSPLCTALAQHLPALSTGSCCSPLSDSLFSCILLWLMCSMFHRFSLFRLIRNAVALTHTERKGETESAFALFGLQLIQCNVKLFVFFLDCEGALNVINNIKYLMRRMDNIISYKLQE